ncbi:MAG: tetratricopeptide repeat protein, partial [Tolypothrix sp. Co-bin9]|nr:tetratricopeptide repeat protein [Tolypothrix sp. Co-bin9]
MLKRLWRWLKRSLVRLFNRKSPSPPLEEHTPVEPRKQPTDAEYESLFLELLAGVNEGWSWRRVRGLLDANKIAQAGLVEWLRGFGARLLVSNAPNAELAARMVQLGELDVGDVGEVARDIGMQLLRGGETNRVRAASRREGAEGAKEREEGDAEAWFERGNEQYEAGNFEDAIASFDKAIEIKPDDD